MKILILIVCILASILTYFIFKSSTCSGDKTCPECPQTKTCPECPQAKTCPECPQTKHCPECPQTKHCPECPQTKHCPECPPANFLGVKGKWDKDFKDTQNPVPGNDKCSQCIIDNSEMMLTPYEYLTANNDTKKLVLKKCELGCS
jgi:membrane protease subunit (stomatin/prohibitin family)